jgi:uncharacterized protein
VLRGVSGARGHGGLGGDTRRLGRLQLVYVDGRAIWVRVSWLGAAYGFHASTDGSRWELVRHFSLGESEPARLGFLAQSARGAGCSTRFDDIRFVASRLADLRSGE